MLLFIRGKESEQAALGDHNVTVQHSWVVQKDPSAIKEHLSVVWIQHKQPSNFSSPSVSPLPPSLSCSPEGTTIPTLTTRKWMTLLSQCHMKPDSLVLFRANTLCFAGMIPISFSGVELGLLNQALKDCYLYGNPAKEIKLSIARQWSWRTKVVSLNMVTPVENCKLVAHSRRLTNSGRQEFLKSPRDHISFKWNPFSGGMH